MGNIQLKSGYCSECGNTEPKPLIKKLCQYHYWKNLRSKSKDDFVNDDDNLVEQLPSPIKTKKSEQTLSELIKLAGIVFNKWVKKRDIADGGAICISCSIWKPETQLQAGHYVPSTYSSLRFNELNVNAECALCNCGDDKHLLGYRKNLIEKIGLHNVIELESANIGSTKQWDRQELMTIIKKYK